MHSIIPLFSVLYSLVLATLVFGVASAVEFNYDDQSVWLTFPGSSCGGNRQSPIDINTDGTEDDDDFTALKFNDYDVAVDGEFENRATNVEFVPDTLGASIENKFGKYILQQFHFHWGRDDTEGSEHTVDGDQFSAEIHFVHLKESASPSDTAGDTFSVVAVFCKAADIPISGVWSELSPVPTDFEEENTVEDLIYDDLLPSNRDYYHYEGSLTTPLCNETVQWFVLKNTINIPQDFLVDLRKVERDDNGTLLTNNFRDTQPLNDREVTAFCTDNDDDA